MSIYDIDVRTRRALCFTPMETDRRVIIEAAVRAEQLGYEAVIVPEGWGFDSGIVISEIALRTERIAIVAGIQSVWGRTPAQLAMQAATLADVSEGRFVLGLGASTPQLATGLHGSRFVRPAARVADALRTVRTLLTGGRGTTPDGESGLRLAIRSDHDVPIWIAGHGPRTVRLALEEADGWFPAFLTPQLVPTTASTPTDDLDTNRADSVHGAGHRRTGCELIVSPAIGVSEDPEAARETVRQLIGWYLVGMGRLYGDHLADAGFAREIAILRRDNERPRPDQIVWSTEIDHLLDAVAVHGDAEAVARKLDRWDARADLVAVLLTPGAGIGVMDMVDAAAPVASLRR